MDAPDSHRPGRSSLLSLFQAEPPRSPELPPRGFVLAMLKGAHVLLAVLGAIFVVAYLFGHPGFRAVASLLFVLVAEVAADRVALAAWFWRRGVLTSARTTQDTTIEKQYVKNGEHVGTSYEHKVRAEFQDPAGRAWHLLFTTHEKRGDSGPVPERLELLCAPPLWGRPRALVLMPSGVPYVTKVLQPGQSVAGYWLWQGLMMASTLAVLAVAYTQVPLFRGCADHFFFLGRMWILGY